MTYFKPVSGPRVHGALVGALLLGLALASGPARAGGPVVTTHSGPVEGVVDGDVAKFLGIPYAAPPVGELRWRAPQAPQPWTSVRDASQPGPACPQLPSPFGPTSDNEDCLYLNVYAPAGTAQDLPVLVWIHGGDFITGQGADFDGSALVETGGIIVVSINYRLGILGFLSHPALDRESADGSSGNYGLLDQQAALRWVRDNIQAFGGDPHKVTVGGESAGGLSTLSHLASPTAAGLFQRAIVESGGFELSWASARNADSAGRKIAAGLGCRVAVARCLRSLTVTQLLTAETDAASLQALLKWGPHVGGAVLPEQPMKAYDDGSASAVPVLMGSNHDEGRLFVGVSFDSQGTPITADNYAATIKSIYGGFATPLVLAAYPLADYANPDTAFATLFGDSGLSCQSGLIERRLARHQPVYVYELADPNAPMIYLPVYDFPYGSTHTSELPYLVPQMQGHENGLGAAVFDADQQQLATTMRQMWARFVASGNPNDAGLPRWMPYRPVDRQVLSLVPPVPVMSDGFAEEHKCRLWDPLLELSAVLPTWLTGAVE